jgi:hypothetical protein
MKLEIVETENFLGVLMQGENYRNNGYIAALYNSHNFCMALANLKQPHSHPSNS